MRISIICSCGKPHSLESIDNLFDKLNDGCTLWKKFPDEIPEEDENCLVSHENEDLTHRAYFHDGVFRSLEHYGAFPLLVTHWMKLPNR
jgi:hypothetical protein